MDTTPPIKMNRPQKPINWLIDKYGDLMRPWEIIISFRNGELDLPNEIIYDYSKSNAKGTVIVKEREHRSMIIQSPESYTGQLGQQESIQWKNCRKVWIVNGIIDKVDANFLGGLYFSKIGDTQVLIGTYPLKESDVHKMKAAGVNGVLNLQTDEDMIQNSVNWEKMKQIYA